MFDRLEDTLVRFEELLSMLSEPDVANDAETFPETDERAGRFGSHRRSIQRI